MDLLEKTRLVIDILGGADPDELAEIHGLDGDEAQIWLRTFLEAGVAALAREVGSETCSVVPLFGAAEDRVDAEVLRRVK